MKPILLLLFLVLHETLLVTATFSTVSNPRFPRTVRSTGGQFSEHELRIINFLRGEGLLPPSTSRLQLTRTMYNNALHNYRGRTNSTAKNKIFSNTRQDEIEFDETEDKIFVDRIPAAARWQKRSLTWRVVRYPARSELSRLAVDNAIRQAAAMWSNVTRIDFSERITRYEAVDIEFIFYSGSYDFDCDSFFESEELAHVRFSERNQAKIHFKGGVEWSTSGSNANANLIIVTAHQLGHVLGLNHSSDRNALMYPGGQNSVLGLDDIRTIQALYGTRTSQAQPQVVTSTVATAHCPIEVTRYMPNGRPMCAAIYKEENCGGERLLIEAGNVTTDLNLEWYYAISSAEVNPGCIMKACTYTEFRGVCINLTGDSTGRNHPKMPLSYDNYVASISCFCGMQSESSAFLTTQSPSPNSDENNPNSCSVTVTRYMPDGRRRMCAAIYKDTQCNGDRLLLEHGNITQKLNSAWIKKISSIEVNPRCSLKTCYNEGLGGLCTNYTAYREEKISRNLGLFDNLVESLACYCNEGNENPIFTTTAYSATTTSDYADSDVTQRPAPRFRLGQVPPPLIPNTNTGTCAVLSTSLLFSNATLTWIKKEEMMRTPLLMYMRSYRYVVTAENCNIYQCTRPNFMGSCNSTGSAQHLFFTNGVNVGSYVCDCD